MCSDTCTLLSHGYVKRSLVLFFSFFFFGKVGTFLVDVAHRNVENTGSVQAWGTSARNMGSLVASLITAGIYACNDDQSFPAGKDAGIDPVMCYYILVWCSRKHTVYGARTPRPPWQCSLRVAHIEKKHLLLSRSHTIARMQSNSACGNGHDDMLYGRCGSYADVRQSIWRMN